TVDRKPDDRVLRRFDEIDEPVARGLGELALGDVLGRADDSCRAAAVARDDLALHLQRPDGAVGAHDPALEAERRAVSDRGLDRLCDVRTISGYHRGDRALVARLERLRIAAVDAVHL